MRKHREALALSQEAFADLVGLHRTYVSDIERATRNPTLTVIDRIAVSLKISLGELLD